MPFPPSVIDETLSPQLAPADGSIDTEHLRRMTLGDSALEREVLAMFLGQTMRLISNLAAQPAQGSALTHTIKGSARAIGAFQVAAAASALEAVFLKGDDPSQALAELDGAVVEARGSIEAILARSRASADRIDPL